jgi:hypothetical protein
MAVKLSSQRVIMPCLKSLQVAMQALCLHYDESDFKKQIASALKRPVNFFFEQLWSFKDSLLSASTFLDYRVENLKIDEKEVKNAIKNAKKNIKKFINDHESS